MSTDESKPSTSKDNAFFDTTLKQLENVSYLNNDGHNNTNNCVQTVEEAKQRIASFIDWFTFDLRRQFCLNPEIWDYDEFEFVLRQLRTSAGAMYKYFKKVKGHQDEKNGEVAENHKIVQLPCRICSKIITLNRDVNFWSELQKHEHFEQLLCDFGNGKLPEDEDNVDLDQLVKKLIHASFNDEKENLIQKAQEIKKSIPSCSSDSTAKSISIQVPQMVSASSNTPSSITSTLPKPTASTNLPNEIKKNPSIDKSISKSVPLAKISSAASIESQNTQSCSSNSSENHSPPHEDILSSKRAASPPLNSFRFNFKVSYDTEIKTKLYPEAIVRNTKKIDRVMQPTVIRCGTNRTICLLCNCEIIARKATRSSIVNNVMNHCMGQKHFQNTQKQDLIACLKQFHETFINFEDTCQAHQVFFRLALNSYTKCVLCKEAVKYVNVRDHIAGSAHKNNVLDLYRKDKSPYYFIELQVKHYGEKFLKKPEEKQSNQSADKSGTKLVKNEESINQVKQVKKQNEKAPSAQAGNSTNKKDKNKKEGKKSSDKGDSAANENDKGHNIILSMPNPDSENVLQRLPHRFANHLPFLEKRDQDVYCTACAFTCINPSRSGLIKHLFLPRHLNLTKIDIVQYAYFCEICNHRFDTELTWEEHFKEGQNKHNTIAESRKNLVHEYECTICKTIIFGDELSLSRHKATSVRKRERFRKDVKLPENVKRFFQSKDAIKREGNLLSEEANAVIKEDVNMFCCQKLEQVLREAFRNCKAYPFGSRCSGLGNWNSDLDVFVDTGDMYKGCKNQDFISQHNFVRTATKIFKRYNKDFIDVFSIPTARTPIVKLYHFDTDLDCDISFKHGLSVENTKFLRFCLQLQPITQPFILLLKRWAELCKLNDNLTTYALAIMAIFFLQVNGYLLSVKQLREINSGEPQFIDGWETINYTLSVEESRRYIKMYTKDIVTLLKDFFLYYATFSYETLIICPLLGETFPRELFIEDPKGSLLPPEMHTYVKQLEKEDAECLRVHTPICVQDPFDLSHNLTKALSVNVTSKLKSLCNLTHKHLESIH